MDWLADIFTSGGLGSIVGLFGGLVSKFAELKKQKAEYSYKIQMAKVSLEETKAEQTHELAIADKYIERAQVEGDLMVEAKEVDAFTESQKNAHKFVGWLAVVRPAITAYVLIACSILFAVVWKTVDGLTTFEPSELKDLLFHMIQAAVFLAVTCTSWWFASRGGNLTR